MTKLIKNNQKGFTLIELMIVVAIIGILAAIAIPQFSAYRERAYIASMNADLNSIKIGQEAYFVDNDAYAAIAETDDPSGTLPGTTKLSSGNKAVVVAVTDINKDYKITVTSSKTAVKVEYDSTTGQTTQS